MKADLLVPTSPNRPNARKCKAKRTPTSQEKPRYYGNGPVGVTKTMTRAKLEALFDRPVEQAAKCLGISTTIIKRLCRRHGIPRWPYRQIVRIDAKIRTNESALKLLLEKDSRSYDDAFDIAEHRRAIENLQMERIELIEGRNLSGASKSSEKAAQRDSSRTSEASYPSRAKDFDLSQVKFEAMLMDDDGLTKVSNDEIYDFIWNSKDLCDRIFKTASVAEHVSSESILMRDPEPASDSLQKSVPLGALSAGVSRNMNPLTSFQTPCALEPSASFLFQSAWNPTSIPEDPEKFGDQLIPERRLAADFSQPKKVESWMHQTSFEDMCNISSADLEEYLVDPISW